MSSRQKQCLRAYLGRRDGWHCHYCKKTLTIQVATLDHVVPRALGGTGHVDNMRLACQPCNRAKADRPPHVFHALMMQGLVV